MPLTKERPWVLAALLGVVLLSVGLRLMPVLFLPSLNWDDEIFQATEPAHRLVFGYGIVAWEFQLGMRSWILPGTIAGLLAAPAIVTNWSACQSVDFIRKQRRSCHIIQILQMAWKGAT